MSEEMKNQDVEEKVETEKKKETKAEKFIRLGEFRMNKALKAIESLENLANKGSYEYTSEQVERMFSALEGKVAKARDKFNTGKTEKGDTFCF